MPARSQSLLIHRYVGLWTGLFLFAIALTGCLLVFQDPIDRALHPSLSRVTPREGRQKVEVELQAVRLAFPDDAPTLVRFGAGPGLADEVRLRSRRSVFVDPYDARVLGVRDREKGPLGVVRAVHVTLFAGGVGRRGADHRCKTRDPHRRDLGLAYQVAGDPGGARAHAPGHDGFPHLAEAQGGLAGYGETAGHSTPRRASSTA